ncbi:threonine-phosphate decarboxylase CobD [Methylococcus capsulatus]|uniref:threonine-phosphate decarboxylase CobD n=1 Tax=Methylococcus capsulatus TaxID=414 RepID=UPI001C52ACA3|nr:threonine-phosphate decarboxylase CobD [Methylococcus capsulatus]QXP87129.1 threonine-phosphate decarboxylase CobD [Methylococcus capsulatus]QXP93191.1 threonine-phosphate decarboxylase CobD [Methylococcus capsulatus]
MLEHGGRLRQAARASGTRPADWLDLSTGISPRPWPFPEIPADCWTRLPEDEDGLIEAAMACYGAPALLPVAGTQAAIQLLPRLRAKSRVAVLSPAYAEHAHGWRLWGHEVHEVDLRTVERQIERFDVVVVVNPNNPTGEYRDSGRLKGWHAALQKGGGWLVVDEAFMDPTPEGSLAAETRHEGLIVLRSFGKFFGCPGARLGFVAARPPLLEALRDIAGPWAVSGPARWLGQRALADSPWQAEARRQLVRDSQRLAALLTRYGLTPAGGTPLFQWVRTDDARRLDAHLRRHLILPRRFEHPPGLRFGLPAAESGWSRLDHTLSAWRAA